MISQSEFAFDAPGQDVPTLPDRRIDITLDRLRASFKELTEAERIELGSKPWWPAVDLVCALRSMERGEEEALGRPRPGMTADIYDSLVSPGEHILEALIRVHNAMLAKLGKQDSTP